MVSKNDLLFNLVLTAPYCMVLYSFPKAHETPNRPKYTLSPPKRTKSLRQKSVPLPVARVLATLMEGTWRLLKKQDAPLLSSARIKFLGLNLDYCIDKAKRELGYEPGVEFAEGMQGAVEWCRGEGML